MNQELIKEAQKTENQAKTSDNKPQRDKRGRLLPGNTANPFGPKPKTKEEKAIKKATKELIKNYVNKLAKALPQISPVLIALAMDGDMMAIKEINDRVMGKPSTPIDLTTGGQSFLPTQEERDEVRKALEDI